MACSIYLRLAINIHMVNRAADGTRLQSEEDLEMPIERTSRCVWRPLSQQYQFLTTTTTLFGRGKQAGGMRRYRDTGGGLTDRAYGDTEMTEMDWAMGSIYLRDAGVDGHLLIIGNTQSIFLSYWSHARLRRLHRSMQFVRFLTHSCRAFIDSCNMCGSSQPGTPSYPLTLIQQSSS